MKNEERKIGIYQMPALCQAFQKHYPIQSSQPQRSVPAPHFKEKATEVQRDYVFTRGHKTAEGPGQSLNSGLWASEPVRLLR